MHKLIPVLPFMTSPIPLEYMPRLVVNLEAEKPTDIAAVRRVATRTARELYPRRYLQALVAGPGPHFAICLADLN